HLLHRLTESPDVAFGIETPIGAVAVELIFRFLQDFRPRLACARAMRVDVVVELDVNGLGVDAARRFRAAVSFGPFRGHHEHGLAEAHFRVGDIVVLVEDDHERVETEGLLQPSERSFGVAVAGRAGEALGAVKFGHWRLLYVSANISSYSE